MRDICHGRFASCRTGRSSLSRKLKWIWVPLPVPFGSWIGAKLTRSPEAKGDRMGELARDDGIVGGAHSLRRRDGDLVLLRAELGEKGVRYHAHLAHRGEQCLAESIPGAGRR